MNTKTIYGIIIYYGIAIGVRFLTNKTDILANLHNDFFKIILHGIGPAIGVVIASVIFKIKFSPMTLKGNYKQIIFPFFVYWLVPVLLISGHTFLTKGTFPVITVFACFIYGLLEEIGWRGFLQQQLKSLPKIWNILIVSILWFIWHLNFEITIAHLLFFGILIFGSWGMGVVADRTYSLLAVAAFHSLNNIKTGDNLIIIAMLLILWVLMITYSKKKKNALLLQKHLV